MRADGIAFARAVVGQQALFGGLRDVLPSIVASGIRVLPLKGVLTAWILYSRPSDRLMSDADLLVMPADASRVVALLARRGGRVVASGRGDHTVGMCRGGVSWTVDLHTRIWDDWPVRLDVADAWRRGTTWASPYGVDLVVPPPEFTFTHGIAHFTREAWTSCDLRRVEEVALLVRWVTSRCELGTLVRYVSEAGAVSAVSYALSAAAPADPPSAALLASLPVPAWKARLLGRVARGGGLPHRRLLWPLLRD